MSEIDERGLRAAATELQKLSVRFGGGYDSSPFTYVSGSPEQIARAAILAYEQHRGKQEPVGAESEVRLHNAAVFEACRHWPATNRGVSYREAFIQGAQWARERYADVGALREALERIAAFYDTHANERLMTTGSYSGFDEPNAVEIARTVLKKGLPSNGQKT